MNDNEIPLVDNALDNDSSWSYSDEEYELVFDGIDADETQTDADRSNISLYMRPDLVDADGNPLDVQTRLNEEFILMNADMLSYNSEPVPHPERTRLLCVTEKGGWAVECEEGAFNDGRDHPANPGELAANNAYALDLLWARMRAMTLRLQIDEFISMIVSRIVVDPDNKQVYRDMIDEAGKRRVDMPKKTLDEQARHPRAIQHAKALLGMPKERGEHPDLTTRRMSVVDKGAYETAQGANILQKTRNRLRDVQILLTSTELKYTNAASSNGGNVSKKGLRRIRKKIAVHRERCVALEAQIARMALRNNQKPLRGERFPDGYAHMHEHGVVFEYVDGDALVAKGKRKTQRPACGPREPDARDTSHRRILYANRSQDWFQWQYGKTNAMGLVLANGLLAPGQFTVHDTKHNPSILANRILVAEQFLDDAWPNRWEQSVWTTRIQVRLATDLMRTKGISEMPVYYIRDITHTLGRLRGLDMASPKNGREQLLMLHFENRVVVIRPLNLWALHNGRARTNDSKGKQNGKKKKGKKKRQQDQKQQSPPQLQERPLDKKDMVWAQGAVLRLSWPTGGHHATLGHPVVTSACIDNTMSPCEIIYIGSFHGAIYRVVWHANQVIDIQYTPQETPIIDLHMQTPHLVAKSISDIMLFHATKSIRPFQTDTGFSAGAYICGALMACLTHTGNLWVSNMHVSEAVRHITPTKDVMELTEEKVEEKGDGDDDDDDTGGTSVATGTSGGDDDDPSPSNKWRLVVPVTHGYRGVYMARREIRVMYPNGVVRRLPIKPGQESALVNARYKAREKEKEMAQNHK